MKLQIMKQLNKLGSINWYDKQMNIELKIK